MYPEIFCRLFTYLGFYHGIDAPGIGGDIIAGKVIQCRLYRQTVTTAIVQAMGIITHYRGAAGPGEPGRCRVGRGRYAEEGCHQAALMTIVLIRGIPDGMALFQRPHHGADVVVGNHFLVGFIASVLGIGWLLDYFSIDDLPWIIASLLAMNWLVALITPEVVAAHVKKASASVFSVLLKPEPLAFFAVYLLLQVSHGPYYVFYSVYLQQHDYSATVTGLLWALGVVAEILVFVWMYRLFAMFSLRVMLLSSLMLSMARWLMIAYGVDSLPVIVGAQLLHAASFGVAHVVAIQFIHRYFGDGHQSKGQALYSSISFGLGGMLGSYYSGYLWDSLGGSAVYVIAAWACGLALLIAYIGVGRKKIAH